ncbi:hypothetical protein [Streptomyces sp. AK02-01A]|uniref:hypothetical protein n=1 Tax=Streptomyces sp. AK02-01A TaxID=3028648 RepID=UPI0029AA8EBF|nr:hypothetical protein [Streptomyces sp. AK02-01A]MDX3851670.1 hypothetical protein [Streptomyces sp. AK02-01A]
MSNITTKAAATKTYVGRWANATVAHMKRRRDVGQGAIEYVGITILVVAIVVALLNTNIGTDIANAFKTKITSILSK